MFWLGKVNHQLKSFDKAIEYFNKYNTIEEKKRTINTDETTRMIDICNNAKKEISHPHRSVITNLGEGVNSSYPDYVPVISADEQVMYFTSRREGSSNNVKDAYGNYHEDVYISYNTYGKWSKAANVGPPVNSDTHDACVALSPDGERMIVYRTAPDLVTGDLYVTRQTNSFNGKAWGPLQKYGKEINSQFIETSACFSNDTMMMIPISILTVSLYFLVQKDIIPLGNTMFLKRFWILRQINFLKHKLWAIRSIL